MNEPLSVEERIRRCLLIEKMNNDKEYCRRFGIENESIFCEITKLEDTKQNDLWKEKDIK